MNKKILRSMLLHIFIVWVVLNLNWILPYVYRVHRNGDYLWKADGTATTWWEYLLLFNYYQPYLLLFILFFYIPTVELNYWYVIAKKSFGKAIITSLIIGFVVLSSLFPWDTDGFYNSPFKVLTFSLMLAGYALIYGTIRKYIHDRKFEKELQLQETQNELKALKAQLNPHFFFNSLNYLYGSALNEKATNTAEAINKLSDMMRYTVTGMNENFVPFKEELRFIENYLALQRARIPERESIQIEVNITTDKQNHQIAPLILLPFVENAFKYGISIDHPCYINIRIEAIAGKLTLEVRNRIITEHNQIKGNNTSIINTRKRLDLLYQNNYLLHCKNTGSEYKVLLSLNLIK